MPRSVVRPLVVTLSTLALLAAGMAPAEARPAPSKPGADNSSAKSHREGHRSRTAGAERCASVDPEATAAGLKVLRGGGNAVDAAVATAAALGVTEPYSAGVGGGGYFVYYDAKTHKVHTIDGRETAPKSMPHDAFIDPATGKPYNFTPELVTSGVSVGVPGTPATWERALRPLGPEVAGAEPAAGHRHRRARLRRRPDVPPADARQQAPVRGVPGDRGALPAERRRARGRLGLPQPGPGADVQADGQAGRRRHLPRPDRAGDRRQRPQPEEVARRPTLPVPPGYHEAGRPGGVPGPEPAADPRRATAGWTSTRIAPSSSGGTTVGEALNILETKKLSGACRTAQALHHYLDASALAFADRNAYVGDPGLRRRPDQDPAVADGSPTPAPA